MTNQSLKSDRQTLPGRITVRTVVKIAFYTTVFSVTNAFAPLLINPDRISGPQISLVYTIFQLLRIAASAPLAVLGVWAFMRRPTFLEGLLAAFGILCLLSAIWSVAPQATFARALPIVTSYFAMIWLGRRLGPDYLMSAIISAAIWTSVASILVALTLPQLGIHSASDLTSSDLVGSWRGVYQHKNSLGFTALTGLIAIIANVGPSQRLPLFRRLGLFAILFVALIGSRSAAAFAGFAVATAAIMFIRIYSSFVRAIILAGAGGIIYIFTTGLLDNALNVLGRDSTFSGRTEIWPFWFGLAAERSVLGWGFASTLSDEVSSFARNSLFRAAGHAHNAYIDTFFMLGAVGVSVFLGYIFLSLIASYRIALAKSVHFKEGIFLFGILSAYTVMGLVDVATTPLYFGLFHAGFAIASFQLVYGLGSSQSRAQDRLARDSIRMGSCA